MAMQRQLWSINGLATELGMDRRTLAKMLDGVPADGTLKGGTPGWHLNTALDLIADKNSGAKRRPVSRKSARADAAILGNYIDRLENWQELRSEPEVVLAIDEVAKMFGVTCETVLVWLRAGMPCRERGCFETGDGFKLVPCWTFDWVSSLSALADVAHDGRAQRALKLL
jgi:hypothetical protein